jgi:hypothetical protein
VSARSLMQTRHAMLVALNRMELEGDDRQVESVSHGAAADGGTKIGEIFTELLAAKARQFQSNLQGAARHSPVRVMVCAFAVGFGLRYTKPQQLFKMLPMGLLARTALNWSGTAAIFREFTESSRQSSPSSSSSRFRPLDR